MIKDRYLVTVISNGYYLDEKLFTRLSMATQFALGASSVLVGLRLQFFQVTIQDRKKKKSLDFYQVEKTGQKRCSERFLKKLKGGRKAK